MNGRTLVNLLHIIIIAPFLAYIAYMGYNDKQVSKFVYILLFLLAGWAFFYHLWKMIKFSN